MSKGYPQLSDKDRGISGKKVDKSLYPSRIHEVDGAGQVVSVKRADDVVSILKRGLKQMLSALEQIT